VTKLPINISKAKSLSTVSSRPKQNKYKAENKALLKLGLKRCSRCGYVKTLDEFANNVYRSSGKCYMCKDCWSKYQRERRKRKASIIKQHDIEKIKKSCSKCGRFLPLKDFQIHPAGKYGRNSECRKCAAKRRNCYRQEFRRKVFALLDADIKCKHCGNSDIRVLQIDHINGLTKEDNFYGGRLHRYILGLPKIEARQKYQILCVNCHILKGNSKSTGYLATLHKKVLKFLGQNKPACNRCGNTDIRVLQIDHIYGSGHASKAEFGGRNRFYRSILAMPLENALKEYQVLCGNCNWVKRRINNEESGNHL